MFCPHCNSKNISHIFGNGQLKLMLCLSCNKEYLSPIKNIIDKRNRPIIINPNTLEEINVCFYLQE